MPSAAEPGDLALEAVTTVLAFCNERLRPGRCSAGWRPATGAPSLLQAAGRGDLTPGEVGRLAALVGEAGKALEFHDVEIRLQRSED